MNAQIAEFAFNDMHSPSGGGKGASVSMRKRERCVMHNGPRA